MKVLTPLPEIASDIPGWLKMYVDGRLKDGAVDEQGFCIYLDPTDGEIHIVDSSQVGAPTVTFLIEERTARVVAQRVETVYTAWMKGWPVRIEGEYAIRDVELIDEILQLYYQLMLDHGHDLVTLFQEG